jgi:hypothetical protein
MATPWSPKPRAALLAAAIACAAPAASALPIGTPLIEVAQGDVAWTFDPFVGEVTTAANYDYRSSSAHPAFGPTLEAGVGSLFFFLGSDGLSFNMIFSLEDEEKGGAGRVEWNIQAKPDPAVTTDPRVLVSDDRNELVRKGNGVFQGRWRWNQYNTDGGAIGPLDGIAWEIDILPIAYKGLKELRVYDGDVKPGEQNYVTLSLGTGGKNRITFTDPPPPNETEVPEPATLALLGLGLAGIGFARRTRARR